jgi:hypothetical protein
MSFLLAIVYGIFGYFVVSTGKSLMNHLGAGTVPVRMQTAATWWVHSGKDPKWIAFFLWSIFVLFVALFLVFVFTPFYLTLYQRWIFNF